MRRRILALALLLTLPACSRPARPGGASPLGRSVITEVELAENAGVPLYDLIQRIRPEYLRPRPSQSNLGNGVTTPPPAVVVGGQRMGTASDLRQVSSGLLVLVRHYGVDEAKRVFGMQYDGGIIELTYRDQVPPPAPPSEPF
jgi:hypothetical protein